MESDDLQVSLSSRIASISVDITKQAYLEPSRISHIYNIYLYIYIYIYIWYSSPKDSLK